MKGTANNANINNEVFILRNLDFSCFYPEKVKNDFFCFFINFFIDRAYQLARASDTGQVLVH